MENEMNIPKEKCPKCDGKKGLVNGKPAYGKIDIMRPEWLECNYCKGKGRLDWVEMAMGAKQSALLEFFEYADKIASEIRR